MAYTHDPREVMMLPTVGQLIALNATAVKAVWCPGTVPHIVRRVAIVVAGITHGDASPVAQVKFLHQKNAFSATISATAIATINLPTICTTATMPVIYANVTGHVEIKPGEGISFNASTAATAATTLVQPILYVEPRWEQPGNLVLMYKTT